MIIANCGGLKVDGTTLYEENGVLKAQGGSGGGVMFVDFISDLETEIITANKTPLEVLTAMSTQTVCGTCNEGGTTVVIGSPFISLVGYIYFYLALSTSGSLVPFIKGSLENNTWELVSS